ncbi:MAG TPA: cysteine-rich CWC family protein [Ideonella sp.]|uniref:cysteine-rich CWC family protein n=1 Tax=Ideonella sp. TaxID=1929293 RepID=UPI002E31E705|nr:cysteine-rich CWC family protein [Ideonella sp.]HEX5683504.1 cysteine-rich CWC family protein [Ideonella sp.]
MTTSSLEESDRCPRCGSGFHCGVADTTPCACSTLRLSEDLRATLRARYTGCLCLACLRALSQGATLEPTPSRPSAR